MALQITEVSANFTRPSNTTAYASGNLVADNTTAGSVHPMQFTMPTGSVKLNNVRLLKSQAATTNAQFRLHLYGAGPTVSNGDGAAWLSTASTYYGSVDLDASTKSFSDNGTVSAFFNSGGDAKYIASPTSLIVYGLLEARAAYTPSANEVFTINLTVESY